MPQERLIQELKQKFHKRYSHATQLSDLLDISMDSAYRRLRGEVQFTFDELILLSKTYAISLDVFVQEVNHELTVKNLPSMERYAQLMESVYFNKSESTVFTSVISYLPLIDCVQFPYLYRFKWFYLKHLESVHSVDVSIAAEENVPEFNSLIHHLERIRIQSRRYHQRTLYSYNILNQVIQQITYCLNSNLISDRSFVLKLLNDLYKWVDSLNYELAENKNGKLAYFLSETDFNCNMLHVNDLLGSCTHVFYSETDSQMFNHLMTDNPIKTWMDNIMPKTTMIKNQASASRHKFISHLKQELRMFSRRMELLI
jgi:hypothetical protein